MQRRMFLHILALCILVVPLNGLRITYDTIDLDDEENERKDTIDNGYMHCSCDEVERTEPLDNTDLMEIYKNKMDITEGKCQTNLPQRICSHFEECNDCSATVKKCEPMHNGYECIHKSFVYHQSKYNLSENNPEMEQALEEEEFFRNLSFWNHLSPRISKVVQRNVTKKIYFVYMHEKIHHDTIPIDDDENGTMCRCLTFPWIQSEVHSLVSPVKSIYHDMVNKYGKHCGQNIPKSYCLFVKKCSDCYAYEKKCEPVEERYSCMKSFFKTDVYEQLETGAGNYSDPNNMKLRIDKTGIPEKLMYKKNEEQNKSDESLEDDERENEATDYDLEKLFLKDNFEEIDRIIKQSFPEGKIKAFQTPASEKKITEMENYDLEGSFLNDQSGKTDRIIKRSFPESKIRNFEKPAKELFGLDEISEEQKSEKMTTTKEEYDIEDLFLNDEYEERSRIIKRSFPEGKIKTFQIPASGKKTTAMENYDFEDSFLNDQFDKTDRIIKRSFPESKIKNFEKPAKELFGYDESSEEKKSKKWATAIEEYDNEDLFLNEKFEETDRIMKRSFPEGKIKNFPKSAKELFRDSKSFEHERTKKKTTEVEDMEYDTEYAPEEYDISPEHEEGYLTFKETTNKFFKQQESREERSLEEVPENGQINENEIHCQIPRNSSTYRLKAIRSPTHDIIIQQCNFGYTFPEGILRKLTCDRRKDKFIPSRYTNIRDQECKPFLNCDVELVRAGHAKCRTSDLWTPHTCNITCVTYLKGDVIADEYQCVWMGWRPLLPSCAVSVPRFDLVKPPVKVVLKGINPTYFPEQ